MSEYGWAVKPDDFELTLPSGAKCRHRLLELDDVAELGLIDQVDTMTSMLVAEEAPAQELSAQEKMKKLGESIKKVSGLLHQVIPVVVTVPRVVIRPKKSSDRPEGTVWLSDIPFEDQVFIFERSMRGLSAFAQFREEQESSVATVENVETVELPPKRATRVKK